MPFKCFCVCKWKWKENFSYRDHTYIQTFETLRCVRSRILFQFYYIYMCGYSFFVTIKHFTVMMMCVYKYNKAGTPGYKTYLFIFIIYECDFLSLMFIIKFIPLYLIFFFTREVFRVTALIISRTRILIILCVICACSAEIIMFKRWIYANFMSYTHKRDHNNNLLM